MIARSDLHQLIDSLPEHELVVAGRFLQELHQRGGDPMLAWAPTDDEPRRRAILRLVRDDERPAGAIAAAFPDVTGPAISQHLRVLREAGLLQERRVGTRRLYRARREGLAELRAWLRDFWDDALIDLKVAAEADQQQQEEHRGH